MFPKRFSIVSYNLWNTERWDVREAAVRQFMELYRPDLLCVQELWHESQTLLDAVLAEHQRVDDDFVGWTTEGNIYWNGQLFEEIEHGAVDVGVLEEHRRLFWVRLAVRDGRADSEAQTILVATVHLTHQGHELEMTSGQSPRYDQTLRTIEALERLAGDGEPVILAGDLNDAYLPTHLLDEAGYRSCFAALGMQCPPTWPCYPTAGFVAGQPVVNQTIDWIVAKGPLRAIAAQSPQCYHGDIAPSDHWPVQAVYELTGA